MRKSTVILIRNAAPSDFGGGERVPVFIAREVLNKRDITPLIFSRSRKLLDFADANDVPHKKTWWWSQQNWSGIRIILTPIYFLWQIVLFIYYLALFTWYRPRVVHIQSKDDFIAGTYAARLSGAEVIWSDYADLKHIFRNHRTWYKNPIGKSVYLAAHFTKEIIVVSKEDLLLISENIPEGPVKQKMKVVYNGAFDSYKPVDKYETFTFISTGRLVTDKGIGELIDAFKKFNAKYADSRLYLLGDGPERELFEKKAADNKAIHFLGYKQNPLEYVAKSHVFLLPTYHEGFSLAIVEACMLGLPVIATNVGGNPEIIRDGETGLLVKSKNVESLYAAMLEVYKNDELRKRLSEAARNEYVTKFNYEKIINDTFMDLYRESL